jgi:3-isopropylmalate dehydrogenase
MAAVSSALMAPCVRAPAAALRRTTRGRTTAAPKVRARGSMAAAAATKEFNITLLPGDGIGPEIMKVAKEVLEEVGSQHDIAFAFTECLVGRCKWHPVVTHRARKRLVSFNPLNLKCDNPRFNQAFAFKRNLCRCSPVGGAAIDATGEPLPAETLATCKASDAVLLAAIGG